MNLSEETAKELIESFDNLSNELREFREEFAKGIINSTQEDILYELKEELKKIEK
jgi:hypothetical protein